MAKTSTIQWVKHGKSTYSLELCGKRVATVYHNIGSKDKEDNFTLSSTIHSGRWISDLQLKALTLEDAKKEVEVILFEEYEIYLAEIENTVAVYKDRVNALKSINK